MVLDWQKRKKLSRKLLVNQYLTCGSSHPKVLDLFGRLQFHELGDCPNLGLVDFRLCPHGHSRVCLQGFLGSSHLGIGFGMAPRLLAVEAPVGQLCHLLQVRSYRRASRAG
jgi:hypothetical protein